MDWKTEATEKLRRYRPLEQAMTNLTAELTRLELEAEALPNTAAHQDRLLSNLTARRELSRSLDMTRSWLGQVDRALAVLTAEERQILHRLYMEPEKGNVGRLCDELSMEQSSLYRRRHRALYKFTLALYGLPDT